LTQQLITFAKGGAQVRRPTALSGVIQESARLALSASRVRCEFSLAEDLWPAEVDAGQIGQVIQNLVQNAWEAMPEEGLITIGAENLVRSGREHPPLPPGQYVRVSITDRGSGIAKEVLPKVFDPYFSTKQRREQKGMGLGLTVCHSVMQKHGGAITVKSAAEIGTTFHLYLPAAAELASPRKAPGSKVPPRPCRILVMEDEKSVREVIGAILQQLGHEVELVDDGQKAVEAFRSARELGRPFDAVILDSIVRTGLGGQETIEALRRIDPTVNAIVMSGYAADPVVLDHEHYGFKGALAKPFDAGKMQEILALIVGN
jgi:CheY-like chemotaxis protein